MTDGETNHGGFLTLGAVPNTQEATPQDNTAGSRISTMLNAGNLVPFALFVVGVALVYMLSLRTGPAPASAEQQLVEARVDNALTQLKNVQSRTSQKILGHFEYDITTRQVPPQRLSGNPFIFYPPSQQPGLNEPQAQGESSQQTGPFARELSESLAIAEKLVLQSVLTGKHSNTAMISGNLITEGQKINGYCSPVHL